MDNPRSLYPHHSRMITSDPRDYQRLDPTLVQIILTS